MMLGKAVVLAL